MVSGRDSKGLEDKSIISRFFKLPMVSGRLLNLLDDNNLARNLYLTLNLLEAGKNIKICINFANELKK